MQKTLPVSQLNPKQRLLICLLPILLYSAPSMASPLDTMAVFRQFIRLSAGYKRLPMHAIIDVKNTSDVLTLPEEDTAAYSLEFFVTEKSAYIRARSEEQVINDSLVVFINRSQKRLSVYRNTTGGTAVQFNKMTGDFLQGAAPRSLADHFVIVSAGEKTDENGERMIKIATKALLAGTSLPRQAFEIASGPDGNVPLRFAYLTHTLAPVDSLMYQSLLAQKSYAGRLVTNGKGLFFIVKSFNSTYFFTKIEYEGHSGAPLNVEQCIVKTPSGHYTPATGFENFKITEHL